MKKVLSQRVDAWSVLPTAALHGEVLRMQQSGKDIVDLTIAISDRPIPASGKDAAMHAIRSENVPYTSISGSEDLKKAILEKVQSVNKIDCVLSEIIVTQGAKQAIFEALYAVTDPGDHIVLTTPYWPAFTQIMTMLRLKPVYIDNDNIESLREIQRSERLKVLILNTPHNPTGKVYSKKEMETFKTFAEANDMYILSDESYESLHYESDHLTFRAAYPELSDRIISIFSFSQSFSMMGWRIGYAVAPEPVINAMVSLQSSITAGSSAVGQAAAAAIMRERSEYTEALISDFKNRRDVLHKKITGIDWITCHLPDGGPYFWCDISKKTTNTLQFCTELLRQKHVAVMPGEAFGAPGHIRIAFNSQPLHVLEDAIDAIASFGDDFR